MLAEGALKVSSLGVAKQAPSLPSSSKNQATSDATAKNEVEGGALAAPAADDLDVVSLSTSEQPLQTKATQDTEQAKATGNTEETSEVQLSPLEQAKAEEEKRLEQITQELNGKLNENLSLKFGQDEESGVSFFQLVEKDTGDVVRQFPPEDLLEFRDKFKDTAGLIFNQEG